MSNKQTWLETHFDVEKLIVEVQNRPALWDMTQKEYSDRIKRKQSWDEVTEIFGGDLNEEDKKQLGEFLHKKWKNVRDRFARDLQERKGKSGDGAIRKVPYMYSKQLEFLRDSIVPKRTVTSEDLSAVEVRDDFEEEGEGDEDDDDILESSPSCSVSTPTLSRTGTSRLGKKRLHPVEDKILRSLDIIEKRAKKGNENADNDDNRNFLLSLLPSLSSLPRHLNTSCRIEILQCLHKFEMIQEQHQQSNRHHHYQQQHHHFLPQSTHSMIQPTNPSRFYVHNPIVPTYPPPRQAPQSPAESVVASYFTQNADERE